MTHINSTDPFCFLVGAELSPFSAYDGICAGSLSIRATVWLVGCGPKGGQNDGKEPQDEHGWPGREQCVVYNTREAGDDSSHGQFMTLDSTCGSEVDATASIGP